MANADALLGLAIPEVTQSYSVREAILYALGVGIGASPTSPTHLRFVYENDLVVLPSMAVVLGHPGFWPRDLDTGLDFNRIVHGEQTLRLFRHLPSAATLTSRSRITSVSDKGPGKGAVIAYERQLFDGDDVLVAEVGQTLFCRGDGGMGSAGVAPPALSDVPVGPPQRVARLTTLPQAALLYRLSGDMNPLHADPASARAAGFDRPILHGLATYGAACFGLLDDAHRPEALRRLDARFRAPVYPGETLETRVWSEGRTIRFSSRVVERDVIVLSHGLAEFAE